MNNLFTCKKHRGGAVVSVEFKIVSDKLIDQEIFIRDLGPWFGLSGLEDKDVVDNVMREER